MKYSDYTTEQIISPIYENIARKLLNMAQDNDTKRKMERNII